MNQNCHGNWFRVGASSYYECSWDGIVLVGDDVPMRGTRCLNCGRKAKGTNHGNVPIKTRIVRQAEFDSGHVVTFESISRMGK